MEIVAIDSQIVRPFTLIAIEKLLVEVNYRIPQPPRVDRSQVKDIIDPRVYAVLREYNPSELQMIYKSATFLRMDELKLNVASIFAAKVFVEKGKGSFEEKRKELGVKKEYSYANMQKLMEANPELQMTLHQ